MDGEKHRHEGSFSEGVEEGERHPEREGAKRDFAEGVEQEAEHTHEGTFGTGAEESEHHPEREPRRTFAEGVEEDEDP
jgi:hypothetical protein